MHKVVHDPSVKWLSERWTSSPAPGDGEVVFSFLSVPFDYAVSHRPGARLGPRAILDALNGYSAYCTDKRVPLDRAVLTHAGTVDVVHSLPVSYQRIRDATAAIPAGFVPVFLGGDHSIADPIVRGLQDRAPGKKLGIIVFDAHFDSRSPIEGKEHSGHWMKTLEDTIDYRTVVQLGISAPIYSHEYMEDAERLGVLVRTPYEIRRQGWRKTIDEAVAHASRGTDGIYISVDIDAMDQAFAPGTSVPNPSGLYPHEVMDAVFEIAAARPTAGLDVNEVSPPLDPHGHTAHVAAHTCMNFMAGVLSRRA